jgi:hypothetical protein
MLQGDAEEAMKVREKILNTREVWFKQNEEEVSKRWTFEEGVKNFKLYYLKYFFLEILTHILY